MEKRFVVFIILTMVVILGYNAVLMKFGPKKPPAAAKNAAAKQEDGDEAAEKQQAESPQDPAKPSEAEKPVATAEAAKPAGSPRDNPHRVVSLGSYRTGASSPLLVTANSRGGSLERVELVQRTSNGGLRYRDLDDSGGYLGNLSLTAEASGCRVHVVPDGTPAAEATSSQGAAVKGIQVGDVIVSLNEKKVTSPRDYDAILAELKPADDVRITLDRQVDSQTRSMQLTAKLGVRPFQLIRPEPLEKGETRAHPLSMLVAIKNPGPEGDQVLTTLHNVEWQVEMLEGASPGVAFRYAIDTAKAAELGLSGPVEVIKRYRLGRPETINEPALADALPPPYHLDFEIEVRNVGDAPQKLAYQLDGTNGLPTEGWWYLAKIHREMFRGAGARDVFLKTNDLRLVGCPAIIDRAKDEEKSPNTPLFGQGESPEQRAVQYIGVDTQYFAAVLLPIGMKKNQPPTFARAEAIALGDVTRKPKGWERTANVTYQLTSEPFTVDANQSYKQSFTLYAGPKDPPVLAAYQLGEWVYYGWFGGIAKLLSGILHFFHDRMVGNYAIAIIMLTVLVRGCMFPISRKAAKNAAMMQELAPEMRKIAEKYKNNMEARGKAQQDLFRKHNYNPLSGCWMMFLQLPVFMGLYRALAVDIELRQAPLIPGIEWASNLAGPDKLFYWKTDFLSYFTDESGWLGPYFNLLPIFTIALFLVQQKMFTPPATDEQTAMQMKMMKIMTIVMGVLFYKVPAGLCVYFITSSLWGIAERKLLPKPQPPKLQDSPPDVPGGEKPAENKPFSFLGPFAPKPEGNGTSVREMRRKRSKRK